MKPRILVAISHPEVSAGVLELARLERGLEVRRAGADEASDVALAWGADLVLVDAPVAHRLPDELRGRIVVAAAGDGAIARLTAQRLGASWMFVDELARELPRLLRATRAGGSRPRHRGVFWLIRHALGARAH